MAHALGPSDSTADDAVKTTPDRRQKQFRAFHDKGVALYELGRLEEAIAVFSTAIRLDPTSSLALYNRGSAHLQQNQFEQAIADYTEAIRLKSGFFLAYMNRSSAYSYLGKLDDALADINEAVGLARPASIRISTADWSIPNADNTKKRLRISRKPSVSIQMMPLHM